MGRLVQPPPTAGADRQHPAGGSRGQLLSPIRRVGPGRLTHTTKSPRFPGRFSFAAFLSLFAIFGLTGWIPTVMMKRGETFAASFGFGALMQIMSFVGGLVCAHLADRRGSSRGVLAGWWICGGLSVVALVFSNTHAVNVTAVALAGFFVIGAMFVLNNFTASSYETHVRATAVGMELSVGRVGAILGPFVAGALQQAYADPTPMFLVIAAASAIAGIAIATLGKRRFVQEPAGGFVHG